MQHEVPAVEITMAEHARLGCHVGRERAELAVESASRRTPEAYAAGSPRTKCSTKKSSSRVSFATSKARPNGLGAGVGEAASPVLNRRDEYPPLRGNAHCARRPAGWRLRPRASCRRGLRGRRFPIPHPRRESSAPAPEGAETARQPGSAAGCRGRWGPRGRRGRATVLRAETMRTNRRSEASPASRTSEVDEGMPARRSQLRARDSGVSGCCARSVIAPPPASRREGRPPRCRWRGWRSPAVGAGVRHADSAAKRCAGGKADAVRDDALVEPAAGSHDGVVPDRRARERCRRRNRRTERRRAGCRSPLPRARRRGRRRDSPTACRRPGTPPRRGERGLTRRCRVSGSGRSRS